MFQWQYTLGELISQASQYLTLPVVNMPEVVFTAFAPWLPEANLGWPEQNVVGLCVSGVGKVFVAAHVKQQKHTKLQLATPLWHPGSENVAFTMIFVAELAIRIVAYHWNFLFGDASQEEFRLGETGLGNCILLTAATKQLSRMISDRAVSSHVTYA